MPNHSHSRMCTSRVTDLDPNTRLVKEVMMASVLCHNHNRILTSRMKKTPRSMYSFRKTSYHVILRSTMPPNVASTTGCLYEGDAA